MNSKKQEKNMLQKTKIKGKPSDKNKLKKKELPKVKKKVLDKENKILIWVFAIIIMVFLLIAGFFFISKAVRFSEYKEVVKFETIQEGDLIFYKTPLSVQEENELKKYNLYLRTKPKKLEKIPFEVDDFSLMKLVAINSEKDFNCEGDGAIAIANLASLHNLIGSEFFVDKNATCDSSGRYNYFYLKEGEETSIEKIGKNCYNLNVNNCEILEVTEKIMVEMLIKYKEFISSN